MFGHRVVPRVQQLMPILQKCVQQPFATNQSLSEVIQVTPKVSQFDQKVCIRVQGLPSHAKITLQVLTESVWQRKPVQFVSCGNYVTGPAGELDLEKDRCEGGTYTGVDPMGLFWSMVPNPTGPQNIRIVIRNVELPVVYNLSLFMGHLTLGDLHGVDTRHQPVSTLSIERTLKPADVRRIPVKEGRVRGMLFLPPGEGPFQGVIDMFGLMGGLVETRSALLASHGFAALALPYFRYDDLPDSIEDLPFQYFEDAARWLSSHPAVRPGGIGITAVSGGTMFGLMMAFKCPEIKAFVRICGQTFHSFSDMEVNGQQFKTGIQADMSKGTHTEEGFVMRDIWVTTEPELIPLWKKDVAVLALVCDDDHQVYPWKTDEIYQTYPKDRQHLMEVVHYPKAGHLLEPPYTPLCRTCYNPFFGMDLLWGGYPREHAEAQLDSWHRMHSFLRKHLPSST